MEDEETALAALCIAGELEAADGEVRVALTLNVGADERSQEPVDGAP